MENFKIIRIATNKKENQITLSGDEMDMIYDALNEFQYDGDDLDDNPASVIMSKLHSLCQE